MICLPGKNKKQGDGEEMGKESVLDMRPVQVCYLLHRSWDAKKWLCALMTRQGIVCLNNEHHCLGGRGGSQEKLQLWEGQEDQRTSALNDCGWQLYLNTVVPLILCRTVTTTWAQALWNRGPEIEVAQEYRYKTGISFTLVLQLIPKTCILVLSLGLVWGQVCHLTADLPQLLIEKTVNQTIFYKSATHRHQWDVGSEVKPDQDWNNWTFTQKQRECNSQVNAHENIWRPTAMSLTTVQLCVSVESECNASHSTWNIYYFYVCSEAPYMEKLEYLALSSQRLARLALGTQYRFVALIFSFITL